jgi:DNA polymerase-4
MGNHRQIIHVDMDAFYASVEQLDNPKLAGKPVIVGGDPKGRGVVSAASYEARKFGVHSAMPMALAIKLCPQAIVLPVRMERYARVSQELHSIYERFTPLVESVSLDEAFLDVTGSIEMFGSAEKMGRAIKKEIKEKLGLTASVGVAPNKFLAKLASDLKKPDGFVVITEQNKQDIFDPLPVNKMLGVGKVTEQALQSHGIKTIAQLRKTSLECLRRIVGNSAPQLLKLACGIDESKVEPFRQAKSLSSEQTFATDIQDQETLLGVLLEQVEEVAQRLRAGSLKANTIILKLRYGDFRTITRSKTLGEATNTTRTLWEGANAIFQKWQIESAGVLRLIGFAVSGLAQEDTDQKQLFSDTEEEKQKRLDKAVDKIKSRYGKDALRRGH